MPDAARCRPRAEIAAMFRDIFVMPDDAMMSWYNITVEIYVSLPFLSFCHSHACAMFFSLLRDIASRAADIITIIRESSILSMASSFFG
jgi:hypothetical protein